MIKTLKTFGVLCAVESVVAVTFLVTSIMCAHAGAIDGVVVALLVAGAALALGASRYRKLTAAPGATYAPETVPFTTPVKRNRPKPVKANPPRTVTKKGKTRK